MDKKVIDLEDALDRVQQDMELLLELFDIFEEDFKVKRKDIEKYLKEKNAEMIRNIAHSLKGASGNISAKTISGICLDMEKESSDGKLDGISEKLRKLDTAFKQYKAEADRIKDENQTL
jgi:HPt (histidine-containing phosphotransfer) domain-containing protein